MSHNKYTDLHALHELIRSDKHVAENVAQNALGSSGDKKSPKSFAQVAISVGQNVLQKSCEPSSKKTTQKEPIKYPAPLRVRYPTYEDRAKVCEAARQAGYKSVSAYLRDVSVEPYKILVPPTDPELTKALLALNKELTAQGNNLNQIAKHLNGGTASPAEGEGMLGRIGRSMLLTHRAIRTALSRGKEPEP